MVLPSLLAFQIVFDLLAGLDIFLKPHLLRLVIPDLSVLIKIESKKLCVFEKISDL
jgi:hypothetical protein